MGLPTIQQIRAFVLVADEGGYEEAEAAGDLGSRANLWQLVQRLEDNLSATIDGSPVSLFQPGGHELTAVGARVLDSARTIDNAVRKLIAVLGDETGHTGPLRISCYPAHAPLVTKAANECWAQNAEENYTLVNVEEFRRQDSGSTLLSDLRSGVLDIVIASDQTLPKDDRDLTTTCLYEARLLAIVDSNHPLFGRRVVDCQDLFGDRLLRSPPGHLTWDLLEACGRTHAGSRRDFKSDSVETLVEMALLGAGVAVVASDSSVLRLTDESLARQWPTIQHEGAPLTVRCCVSVRTSMENDPSATALINSLRHSAQDYLSPVGGDAGTSPVRGVGS